MTRETPERHRPERQQRTTCREGYARARRATAKTLGYDTPAARLKAKRNVPITAGENVQKRQTRLKNFLYCCVDHWNPPFGQLMRTVQLI